MRQNLIRILILAAALKATGLTSQTWCTPFVANALNSNIGVTAFSMGTISNSSSAQSLTLPYYNDYSSKFTAVKKGANQSFSITVGSVSTKVTLFIDWNNDGDFADAGESIYTGTGTGATLSSSLTVPLTASAGAKRLRLSADGGAATPAPCANANGEFEDYTFVVQDSSQITPNIGASLVTSPASRFSLGANNVTLRAVNLDPDTSVTSFTAGYSINGSTISTQSVSGVSVNLRPGTDTGITFSTTYTPGSMGICTLRVWAEKPNGGGTGRRQDDTVTRIMAMCNALSGAYTIDPAGSGSSNFRSFAEAWFFLNSCGVGGPVTISVAPGTYNERLVLREVSGMSATNTVTFTGAGSNAAAVVLRMSTFDNLRNFIVNIERSRWWKFNNMTIRNEVTSSISRCIQVQNGNQLTFSGLVINAYNNATAAYTNAPFYVAGNKCDSINLLNSTLTGGTYPVYFLGQTGSRSNLFRMSGCTLSNAPEGGAWIQYVRNTTVDSCIIDMSASTLTTVYGLRIDYCDSNTQINRNRITNILFGGIGIRLFYCEGSRVNRATANNNMITVLGTAANCYGIYHYYSPYFNLNHNSILLNTSTTSSYCLGIAGVGTYRLNIYNNLLTNRGAGRVMLIQSSGLIEKESYNGLYTTGATLAVDGATTKSTLALWQAVAPTKYGIGDFTGINPAYKTVQDLHLSSACSQSRAPRLSAVLKDLDAQNRDTQTFIGADEVAIKNKDAAPTVFTAPTNPVTVGNNNVIFTLANRGYDSLNSVTLAYSMNGGTVSTVTFTLTPALQACATRNLTISNVAFGVGRNYLKLYITKLNGTINDQNPADDTLAFEFCARYNGQYTIDKNKPASATNFTGFNDAVAKLTGCGISGPVTVRVVEGSGPYQEMVKFSAAIPGASRINTITFKGNYLSDTLYYNNSNSSDPGVVKLSGVSHITFDSLTVINGSSAIGYGFHITGNSDSCTISNCIIKTPVSTGNVFVGILAAGSLAGTGANHGDYLRILNNRILGCAISVYAFGANTSSMNADLIISNNELLDFYLSGVYIRNHIRSVVTGNTITASTAATTTGSTVVLFNADRFTFSENQLLRCGQYGIELNNANVINGSSAAKATISNNFIGGNWRNTAATAVNYITSSYINLYHNTISMPTGTALVNTATNAGHQVKNNIFSVHNSSAAVISWTNSTALDAGGMDYNLYYNNNNNASVITVFGATLSSGSLSSSGHNGNSKYGNPDFIDAANNLHTFGSNPNNSGVTITGITKDIDGDARPFTGTAVDIGADEYSPLALDISATGIDGPIAPFIKGSNSIMGVFKNFGSTFLDSFKVKWYVNDTLKGTTLINTPLNSGNQTIENVGSYNFGHGRYKITLITTSPNGSDDDRPANDTLITWVCAALSGTYTINSGAAVSSTNYSSMKQALLDCYECGISASVTFNTASGSGPYYGPVELGPIPGAGSAATVTLNGNNTMFTAATTQTNNAVMRLNGTSFLRINELNIRSTSVYYAWGLHLMNAAGDNRFYKCSLSLPNVFATNGQQTAGLVYSASRSNPFVKGRNAFRNHFTNGAITAGSGGAGTLAALCSGHKADTTTSNVFHYNHLSNYIYNGIYTKHAGGDSISYNIIEAPTAQHLKDKNGAMIDSGASSLRFIGNIIRKPFSDTANANVFNGIRFNEVNSGSGKDVRIWNNLVYHARGNGKQKGLMITNSSRISVLHNTLALIDAAASASLGSAGIEITGSSDPLSNITVKNNLISVNRGGTGTKYAVFLSPATSSAGNQDYNNLHVSGTNSFTGSYNNADFASLGAWKSAATFDQNSIAINPLFNDMSTGEMYPSNPLIDKSGNSLGITRDAFGNPRHPSKPDLGAVEFAFELRTDTTDHTSSYRLDARESHWYQALDDSGKLVLAIRPAAGDPLGTVLWKVRILRGVSRVRSMRLFSSPTADQGWFLNRNFVIEPTNSPASAVGVRLYTTRQEINDMRGAVSAAGKSTGSFNQFVNDSLQVTKYDGGIIDLDPTNGVYSPGIYNLLNPDCDSFSNLGFYALRFNTSSFSEFNPSFIPGQLVPLPLNFLNVQASWSAPGALVQWKMASTDNISGFIVERSTDGLQFIQAGGLSAMSAQDDYQFNDISVNPERNPLVYYRIVARSHDGQQLYSPVVKLMTGSSNKSAVAPNPFSQSFSFTLPAQIRGLVKAEIITTGGRQVYLGQFKAEPGHTRFMVKPDFRLPAGIYLFKVEYPGGVWTEKLMAE